MTYLYCDPWNIYEPRCFSADPEMSSLQLSLEAAKVFNSRQNLFIHILVILHSQNVSVQSA